MGMFSFIEKGLGFRTGATKAARDAKEMGQQSLADIKEFQGEVKGLYDPYMQKGQEAFSGLSDFYSGNQQPIIDQATDSPFYQQMIDTGESSIARNAQATGGFRSGTTQENLAQNSQGVLMSLVQQILQGKGGIADTGFNAVNQYGNTSASLLNQSGETRGNIANIGISQAANKANVRTGIAGMMHEAGMAFIPSAGMGGG